jgi:hypothetical protein
LGPGFSFVHAVCDIAPGFMVRPAHQTPHDPVPFRARHQQKPSVLLAWNIASLHCAVRFGTAPADHRPSVTDRVKIASANFWWQPHRRHRMGSTEIDAEHFTLLHQVQISKSTNEAQTRPTQSLFFGWVPMRPIRHSHARRAEDADSEGRPAKQKEPVPPRVLFPKQTASSRQVARKRGYPRRFGAIWDGA